MTLENDEKTDQTTPSLSFERKDVECFEKNEEGIACVDEIMIGIFMELGKEPMTLKDREPKDMSITNIHVEKLYDGDEHDALMSQVTYGDPPLKKPSEPLKPILKPLPSGLKYASLGNNEMCPVVIHTLLPI